MLTQKGVTSRQLDKLMEDNAVALFSGIRSKLAREEASKIRKA
jgi:hypothetical protein